MEKPDQPSTSVEPSKPTGAKRTRYSSEMPLARLYPSPNNSRRRFDEAGIRDLAASIAADGIINPLTVVEREELDPDTGKPTYYVIAGERRRRAATLAGLQHVPVVLLIDPELIPNATRIALAENTVREALNTYEETMALLDFTVLRLSQQEENWPSFSAKHPSERHAAAHAIKLFSRGGKRHAELKATTGVTAQALHEHFSGLLGQRDGFRPNSFVSNRAKLLDLPEEVQRACQAGELEYTKANLIGSVEDDEQRQAVLERAINESLTHKQLARIVKEARGKDGAPDPV